jgi:hypothetical protein
MDPDGMVALVAAIVRGAPSWPRAARIGHHQLFDEIPVRGRHHRDQSNTSASSGPLPAAAGVPSECSART